MQSSGTATLLASNRQTTPSERVEMRSRVRRRYLLCLIILLMLAVLPIFYFRRQIALTLRRHKHLFSFRTQDLAHAKNISVLGTPRSFLAHRFLSDRKLVLLWNDFFDNPNYVMPLKADQCPRSECDFTSDRKHFDTADAVLFHLPNLNGNDLPTFKRSNQRWILLNHESPDTYNYPKILKSFDNLMDHIVTYRYFN
jgi:hypothetical protein